MRLPGRDRIGIVDARGREDRLRELADGGLVLVARKDPLRPRGGRIGDDVPVDVEARDLLQRRLVGDGIRLVGARDLGRVLVREQHRVLADNGEPRSVGRESLADALIEPAGRTVETRIGSEAIARKRDLLIGQDRRHQTRARLVSLGHDAPRQRQRRDRRGQEKVLSRLKPEAHLNRRLGQPLELCGIDRREIARMRGHGAAPGRCRSSG